MDSNELQAQGKHNRDLVNHLIHSHITKLFKANLALIESYRDKTITAAELELARKHVLDSGNDTIRDIHSLIDVFDFYLNPERLDAARQGKKTIKKVVVSGLTSVR